MRAFKKFDEKANEVIELICIDPDNSKYEHSLIIYGKYYTYKDLWINEDLKVWISRTNNFRKEFIYYKERFRTTEQLRNDKINLILNN